MQPCIAERLSASLLRYVLAVLIVLAAGPLRAQQPQLRLHGSNTIGDRLAPALVEAWARQRALSVADSQQPRANERTLRLTGAEPMIVEIHAHGTGTGYADLLAHSADIWMASRPVTVAELQGAGTRSRLDAPEHEHVLALDGLAAIVHPRNRVERLTVAQLRDVFSGRIRDWKGVGGEPGPIRVYARDDSSGTFDTLRSLVLRDAALSAAAQRFESTAELATAVARDPAAIGVVGVAGVGQAKTLAISDAGTRPLVPDRLSVATEDYVLSRRLFLYTGDAEAEIARDFIEFALGPEGQAVVEQLGFVSQRVAALPIATRQDAPQEYRDLTQGAQRLSINFRFSAGETYLDTKALRDLDRLAEYLNAPERQREQLMLFGFVDGNETNPCQALALSSDRADYVAQQLVQRGVPPRKIRGMGGVAPVASNDTESGRGRNRRVEVWLRAPGSGLNPPG